MTAGKKPALFVILLLCVAAVCEARGKTSTASQSDSNATFLLGPSVVVLDKPYSGKDAEVFPYPAAMFIYDRFYFAIDKAGCRLLANQRTAEPAPGTTLLYLDASARWRSDGYDSDDSDKLEGMHNRHKTMDVGGEFGVAGEWGTVTVNLVTDSLNHHNGRETRVIYSKTIKHCFDVNTLNITPLAGLALQSENLVNYYYGVRSDEVRPGRPAYRPDSAVNVILGINANYRLDRDWTMLAGINYYLLDDEIRDSPIVSRDYTISFIGGAMYKF
jgi:outer membrane protein